MDCTACCEKYNKTSRKCVTCPKCLYQICKSCYARYLSTTSLEAHCLNPVCGVFWDLTFLLGAFSRAWLDTTYRAHVKKLLFDSETSLLPVTMGKLAAMAEHARKQSEEVPGLRSQVAGLSQDLVTLNAEIGAIDKRLTSKFACPFCNQHVKRGGLLVCHRNRRGWCPECFLEFVTGPVTDSCPGCSEAVVVLGPENERTVQHHVVLGREDFTRYLVVKRGPGLGSTTKIGLVLERRSALDRQRRDVWDRQSALEREIFMLSEPFSASSAAVEKRDFVKKCATSDCRGFLNTQYHCELCDEYFCPRCHERVGLKDEKKTHECNPQTVETVEFLKKDSKPCPSCGVLIHRIEGCSQMFCTQCNTPFCWRTGKKITSGPLHNPHYLEWTKNHSKMGDPTGVRANGDIPCGGIPGGREIGARYGKHPLGKLLRSTLEKFVRRLDEIQDYVVRVWAHPHQARDNEDLRMAYLQKHIDDVHFKKVLMQRERQRLKQLEDRQVWDMLLGASGDLLRSGTPDVVEQLVPLVAYARDEFGSIGEKYGLVSSFETTPWMESLPGVFGMKL